MFRLAVAFVAAASFGTTAACTDFATPAQLDKPLVIAVIADPPVVAPGATTALELVVAGPDGLVSETTARWSVIETFAGVPPMGTINALGVYQAPAVVPARPEGVPPLDTVAIEVDLGDRTVNVVKAIAVTDLVLTNPTISGLTVDGVAAAPIVIADPGQTRALQVTVDPAPGEDATFAWYATIGDIERYQSNPVDWAAGDDVGDGFLFVVVRDGQGGVDWASTPVRVGPVPTAGPSTAP